MRPPLGADPERVLRFGIIGLGTRAWQHIDRINANRDACEILAICDVSDDRLGIALERCSDTPATYTDHTELLEHEGINVVLIAAPHNLHAPMAIEALGVGCDVMVAEQHRYFALNQKARELVQAGEIGKVVCVCAPSFRGPWAAQKTWLNQFETSGGGLLSEACHDLDAFAWIIGSRATRVTGFGGTRVFEGQDTLDSAQLVYEFGNGTNLYFGFGIFVPGGYRDIAILGSHGRLEYTRHGKEIRQYGYSPGDRQTGKPIVHGLAEEMAERGHPGTDAIHREFIRCVRDRAAPLTDGTVMVDSVRMCTAGQMAVREGRVVEITEQDAG
ncbi:MAG: Gfo/Idh/MocA family oxidoreductase [Candidatus Latescibacteria bacterium]|nr:Gfo/Idh/MocA family oxidoreductase [Candidatus Latescibacterota bacterium]